MEAAMDQPCRWHTPNPAHPSNHLTKDCTWTKYLMQKGAVKDAQGQGGNAMMPPPPACRAKQQLPPPPPLTGANALRCVVSFVTEPTDKQSLAPLFHGGERGDAVPKYMPWSIRTHVVIPDHPKIMPNPGGYALVVDPIMKGPTTRVKFSKVLIDNGSSINIMYKHTMHTLGITENMLQPTHTTFHGIVPGVPRELAEHSLNVRKDAKPVRQPLHRFAEDRRKIIGEEVTKLLVAGFILEVTHTEWLANPVMVEKKKDENLEAKAPKVWRMCIDYTNLNKACPRDPFPLPRIDQVIDSTAGCELLSFLDAYSGFHQIPLKKEDQIKTAFITPHGAYCYITMPFGLRNAGATYQRCMQKCLFDQIGKNVQVYVDDIVVKTKIKDTLIDDIRQTFDNLRRFWMKLNPAKCTFGVPAGKLLGFLVSSRGIEVNPVKIRAIERMTIPQDLKDVQKFTGSLASLSRFISRLGEKALPLYALMKKSDKFVWTPQADATFKELKTMLATAPILASPLEREPMLLYIAATNRVVSVVVVVEREEEGKTVQRPVYYLSEVLSLSKQNYPHFQKMTYGVFMAATKLKHYFEEHPMKVVSEAPISDIMCNKDASGRIAKWAIQISPYVPVYERRDAIKSQALADFLVDWAEMQYKPPDQRMEYWKMHFDGSKLKEGLGAGVVLTSPKGDHLRYVLQVHFRASNNVAEYEALIHGLKVAKEIGAHRIICYGDSDLVVQQCSGDWDAKDANIASYRFHVQKISGFFEGVSFTMYRVRKMKLRMLCPSWAHPGKKFLPE
ncbi:hypothetical protein QYE76_069320 [Lolium multiflorum]|uniref:Uncharacterized protein n=1 Tax=Lolium multiflorum TaxID=4521 RepID=A0AAD8WDD9_LOLMU|nr:hypothetical protein QYE76_069320 [Lolium multiflorum]